MSFYFRPKLEASFLGVIVKFALLERVRRLPQRNHSWYFYSVCETTSGPYRRQLTSLFTWYERFAKQWSFALPLPSPKLGRCQVDDMFGTGGVVRAGERHIHWALGGKVDLIVASCTEYRGACEFALEKKDFTQTWTRSHARADSWRRAAIDGSAAAHEVRNTQT